MNVFAYCSHSLRRFVRRAAGVSPTLSPPTTMQTFRPSLLAGRRFVWLKLHGIEGDRCWYGDDCAAAVSAGQLAAADLQGAVVLVSNAWLAHEDGRAGPMLRALARANPRAIIGGSASRYAQPGRLGPSDLLALYLRWFLQVGFTAFQAFQLAKTRLTLRLRHRRTSATQAVLSFRLWRPLEVVKPRELAGA